jgi:hypothetical protein
MTARIRHSLDGVLFSNRLVSKSIQKLKQIQKIFRAPFGAYANIQVPALQGRSDLCIIRNETARPRSQFSYSRICERFIYSQDRSTYFAAAKKADLSWEYINRSQIHECRDWETRPSSLISGKICFEFSVQCVS